MRDDAELRLFQLVVCLAAIIPLAAGGAGVWFGPAMIHRSLAGDPDLESHFRYLSGLLLAIGVAFIVSAFSLKRRGGLFQALGLIVVTGGLARLLEAARTGFAGGPHRLALVMELLVVPLLMLWAARLARRTRV